MRRQKVFECWKLLNPEDLTVTKSTTVAVQNLAQAPNFIQYKEFRIFCWRVDPLGLHQGLEQKRLLDSRAVPYLSRRGSKHLNGRRVASNCFISNIDNNVVARYSDTLRRVAYWRYLIETKKTLQYHHIIRIITILTPFYSFNLGTTPCLRKGSIRGRADL